MKRKQPILASEFRLGKGRSLAIASNGEYNANDKKDLWNVVNQVLSHLQQGGAEIVNEETAAKREQATKLRREAVIASFDNREAHVELGATITNELYQAANREGICRRFLGYQELAQGNIPRVKLRSKNVTAVTAGSPTKVETQIVRDKVFFPSEMDIIARPFIEEREIQQSIDDVLEEKFIEAQEAMMVAEDRLWRLMAEATIGSFNGNDLTLVTGAFTLASITSVASQVSRWNLNTQNLFMSSDLREEFASSQQVANVIDPVSQHELLMTGKLGVIYGMSVLSDAYRHPQHKVLSRGEFYVISDPVTHGVYTDRGGITSAPIDISIEQKNGRGWVLSELFSAVIGNSRSVAKGRRV